MGYKKNTTVTKLKLIIIRDPKPKIYQNKSIQHSPGPALLILHNLIKHFNLNKILTKQ